jgi:hypothetical protein
VDFQSESAAVVDPISVEMRLRLSPEKQVQAQLEVLGRGKPTALPMMRIGAPNLLPVTTTETLQRRFRSNETPKFPLPIHITGPRSYQSAIGDESVSYRQRRLQAEDGTAAPATKEKMHAAIEEIPQKTQPEEPRSQPHQPTIGSYL